MSVGVIGPWANVRCTGRYDNINFRIKGIIEQHILGLDNFTIFDVKYVLI